MPNIRKNTPFLKMVKSFFLNENEYTLFFSHLKRIMQDKLIEYIFIYAMDI